MTLLRGAFAQKDSTSNDLFVEKSLQKLCVLKSLSLKASYGDDLCTTDVESLFGDTEAEFEAFLSVFNTHFRQDTLLRDSFTFSESTYLEILNMISKYSLINSLALVSFMQNIFRFAFPCDSQQETQLLLLAHDEFQHSPLLFSAPQVQIFVSLLDANRIAILRPNSPFLLAIRILEKSQTDFTEIFNTLFFKVAMNSSSSNFFSRKKIFLYELLGQALHTRSSFDSENTLISDSLKLVPCFTASLFQLIFYYLFELMPQREKDGLSKDITQFFKEIRKSGKASLLAYVIYFKFVKSKGTVEEIRFLEAEMNSKHWVAEIDKIREASDIIPQGNPELLANVHYFLQYLIDEPLPNSLRLFSNFNCLGSIFIPLSTVDARDIILISAYSKLKLWADIYRIYSNVKTEGRLDIPASGIVRSPIFHLSLSTIIFKNVLNNISWNEVIPYLEFPSPLLSREGFRIIYTHLYSKLFNLLISYDKFLLIQSIVIIPRSLFIKDDYILPCILSTFACSSGRGPLGPPNRILFYKLLSNRLDIDIICESSPTPPSNLAGIIASVDPQLSNLLHFIELHKIPLSPSNFLSLILSLFRRRRYDLVCQTFNFRNSHYKQESYLHYIYLASALKNREYGIVRTVINEKSKSFLIPEQNLLQESISNHEIGLILPSSMSSVAALDKWREQGLVSDADYSSSLAICLNYNLENLFYLRRFISLQQQDREHAPKTAKNDLKARFPDSVVRLSAIPNYLLEYENRYFSIKKKQNVIESDDDDVEGEGFSNTYLLDSENL
ncbi:hypothetical protein DI09_61p150 [Mitosporidium daphniae]|uniref:Uncharacterized protein n=1 Tax=Mitosporidium daphniae TaxID=1485682 RepID=A0A098VNJ5_9MICR|nr:uncharacterized protein DI09_61p150 [Mitosporidium daphniae]KGG50628.1 hypothetical protein DI09_61p150 [Mitosporidium daphniae]|eukprot:XP_013237055.1 uncharacterized protein DI09_61p150 [Mitosporidium daphniae]